MKKHKIEKLGRVLQWIDLIGKDNKNYKILQEEDKNN